MNAAFETGPVNREPADLHLTGRFAGVGVGETIVAFDPNAPAGSEAIPFKDGASA